MPLPTITNTASRSGIVTATIYNEDKANPVNWLQTNLIGAGNLGGADLALSGVTSRHTRLTTVYTPLGANVAVTTAEITVFTVVVDLTAESAAQNFLVNFMPTVIRIASNSGTINCRFRLKRGAGILINDRHSLFTATFQQYVLPARTETVAGGASYTYLITAQTDTGTFSILAASDVVSTTQSLFVTAA